jgi:formate dehydrogenase subunit gamma
MSTTAESLVEVVENAIEQHRGRIGPLMPVLHSIQEALGCVPPEAVPIMARAMNLSRAEIHGVMSFYHDFRTQPPGEHVVQLCRAEACQAMGSRELEAHARAAIDGDVTLEPVYCLGNCACAPAVMIDGITHGRVSAARFDALVGALTEGE